MSSDNVKQIYKQNNQTKGVDFVSPILVILFIVSIFGYLYSNVQRKLLHKSWTEQKCNPKYLFFSGFLHPTEENPWITNQQNFKQCVSSNIYKDPSLTRIMGKNQDRIDLHKKEMKQNLNQVNQDTEIIKENWNKTAQEKKTELVQEEVDTMDLFDDQSKLYEQVLYKTQQMFHVLSATVRYLQGILIYNVSNYKQTLSIDQKHEEFMRRYAELYPVYADAFHKLENSDFHRAIESARTAIDGYNQLNKELDAFMDAHYSDIEQITASCYQLKYNMNDQTCSLLFPNLNQTFIDFYSTMKDLFKTKRK